MIGPLIPVLNSVAPDAQGAVQTPLTHQTETLGALFSELAAKPAMASGPKRVEVEHALDEGPVFAELVEPQAIPQTVSIPADMAKRLANPQEDPVDTSDIEIIPFQEIPRSLPSVPEAVVKEDQTKGLEVQATPEPKAQKAEPFVPQSTSIAEGPRLHLHPPKADIVVVKDDPARVLQSPPDTQTTQNGSRGLAMVDSTLTPEHPNPRPEAIQPVNKTELQVDGDHRPIESSSRPMAKAQKQASDPSPVDLRTVTSRVVSEPKADMRLEPPETAAKRLQDPLSGFEVSHLQTGSPSASNALAMRRPTEPKLAAIPDPHPSGPREIPAKADFTDARKATDLPQTSQRRAEANPSQGDSAAVRPETTSSSSRLTSQNALAGFERPETAIAPAPKQQTSLKKPEKAVSLKDPAVEPKRAQATEPHIRIFEGARTALPAERHQRSLPVQTPKSESSSNGIKTAIERQAPDAVSLVQRPKYAVTEREVGTVTKDNFSGADSSQVTTPIRGIETVEPEISEPKVQPTTGQTLPPPTPSPTMSAGPVMSTLPPPSPIDALPKDPLFAPMISESDALSTSQLLSQSDVLKSSSLQESKALPKDIQTKVIAVVEQALKERKFPIEVALDPPELGSVRISIQSAEHGVSFHIQAERPEILDLLRRHSNLLSEFGMDRGGAQVNLSFGSLDSQEQAFERPTKAAKQNDLPVDEVAYLQSVETIAAHDATRRNLGQNGRLDMKV